MQENINIASSGGDLFIWAVTFGILIIAVGYLVYISKDFKE